MLKKILISGVFLTMCLGILSGCTDYGYEFHYSVTGGNGEITVGDEALLGKVRLCSESFCELKCPENSYHIHRLGGKKGSHQLTFIATPDEGFQVKEWLFNGKIVDGNNTTSYTAKVSNEQNYNGVIAVVFEPTPNNQTKKTGEKHEKFYKNNKRKDDGATSLFNFYLWRVCIVW